MAAMFEHILLGIIQGITEFLPVSSSGHLTLAEQFLKIHPPKTFEMLLHLGTLLAVIFFFRDRLWKMLLSLFRRDEHLRLVGLFVLASIPTGVIGIALRRWADDISQSNFTLGAGWLFTGTLLFLMERWPKPENKAITQASFKDALAVGLWQGVSILPGVSRSGMTICAGLFQGFTRGAAVEFSFILSIPLILGASLLDIKDAMQSVTNYPWSEYIAGTLAAFIVGLLAIRGLLYILKTRQLSPFAYYCWILGSAVIFWSFLHH